MSEILEVLAKVRYNDFEHHKVRAEQQKIPGKEIGSSNVPGCARYMMTQNNFPRLLSYKGMAFTPPIIATRPLRFTREGGDWTGGDPEIWRGDLYQHGEVYYLALTWVTGEFNECGPACWWGFAWFQVTSAQAAELLTCWYGGQACEVRGLMSKPYQQRIDAVLLAAKLDDASVAQRRRKVLEEARLDDWNIERLREEERLKLEPETQIIHLQGETHTQMRAALDASPADLGTALQTFLHPPKP